MTCLNEQSTQTQHSKDAKGIEYVFLKYVATNHCGRGGGVRKKGEGHLLQIVKG